MAEARITQFRQQMNELARKLAIEQGHYPKAMPLQHTMDPADAQSHSPTPPTSETNG